MGPLPPAFPTPAPAFPEGPGVLARRACARPATRPLLLARAPAGAHGTLRATRPAWVEEGADEAFPAPSRAPPVGAFAPRPRPPLTWEATATIKPVLGEDTALPARRPASAVVIAPAPALQAAASARPRAVPRRTRGTERLASLVAPPAIARARLAMGRGGGLAGPRMALGILGVPRGAQVAARPVGPAEAPTRERRGKAEGRAKRLGPPALLRLASCAVTRGGPVGPSVHPAYGLTSSVL